MYGHPSSAAKTRRLAVLALLIAVTALFAFSPVGFISIPPLPAITIVHIPVLVGVLYEGLSAGLLLGACFGVFSLLRALTPASPIDTLFINPLVSILPRLLIPLLAWAVYKLVLRWVGGKARYPVAWILSALLGTLTNTVGVLTMLYIVYAPRLPELMGVASSGVMAALGGVVVSNGIAEAVAAALIVPALMRALTARKRGRREESQP